jgi:hypothetical protein
MPIHPEGFASRHGVPAPAATFHPLPIFAANTARAPRSSAMTISAPRLPSGISFKASVI